MHGSDGLDEITTTGATLVYEITGAELKKHVWMPQDFGVPQAMLQDLEGGDRARNAEIARAVLGGKRGPQRDVVVVNAAVAIVAAGRAADLRSAMQLAGETIDSGAAGDRLDALIRFSAAELKPARPASRP